MVDDQALSRAMVKAALKELGFTNVTLLESGEDAATFLRSHKVDVIIADWRMPGVTGLDLLKWVRATEELKNVPFLMLTGERTKESVVSAAQAGVSDYLVKPFSQLEFAKKLAAITQKNT